ncbi:MAG: DUF3291 domain-containing protein [Hyphomonadaceae bacterium]|nr:DUF3291 domain-containing protein [Hyphomonadaceae bacterium]
MPIAELNIARLRHPLDDPRSADFANNLERINALAERSPGFMWRLKDDAGDATGIRVDDDPLLLINVSVWESAEALERFVFHTVHQRFYARRREWFDAMDSAHVVMWRVAEGAHPSAAEAMARLERYRREGASEHAFGWEQLIGVERLAAARRAMAHAS